MDFYFWNPFLLLVIHIQGISSFTVTTSQTRDGALYGQHSFHLTCAYSVLPDEMAVNFEWLRNRPNETDFKRIARFFPPNSKFFEEITDPALIGRLSLTRPTAASALSILTFTEVQCDDEGIYKCEATYTSQQGTNMAHSVIAVHLTTIAKFHNGTSLTYSPNSTLLDTDEVTFTCEDDVGKNPKGTLRWYYFLENQTVGTDVTSLASETSEVFNTSSCSYWATSTLRLMLGKRFDQFVVRCTLGKFYAGNGYRQTDPLHVYSIPTITQISKSPDRQRYPQGETVTLICSGEGNPIPTIEWILANGTVVQSSELFLVDLSASQNHTYTCCLLSTIGELNYTTNKTVMLEVVEDIIGNHGMAVGTLAKGILGSGLTFLLAITVVAVLM